MPDLSTFAAMAARAGVVPRVPQPGNGLGNRACVDEVVQKQWVSVAVPHVPHVPLESGIRAAQSEWQVAFDERAAILEYDEELPRPMAEKLAREQIKV